MHKEEGKTGSWKSPAQNTIDSPGLRRALNGQQDTEQDNTAANMRQKGKMRGNAKRAHGNRPHRTQ